MVEAVDCKVKAPVPVGYPMPADEIIAFLGLEGSLVYCAAKKPLTDKQAQLNILEPIRAYAGETGELYRNGNGTARFEAKEEMVLFDADAAQENQEVNLGDIVKLAVETLEYVGLKKPESFNSQFQPRNELTKSVHPTLLKYLSVRITRDYNGVCKQIVLVGTKQEPQPKVTNAWEPAAIRV